MITKYKADHTLRDYKVTNIKKGTTKNGAVYTKFRVSDARQVNNKWVYDNYDVWSFQEDLDLEENDRVQFADINGFEFIKGEYNGHETLNRTIFAEINVIANGTRQPKQPQILDDGLGELDDIDSTLPF